MSDIKGTISSITKSVTKTSGDFIKTTKLNINLSSAKSELKAIYQDIGKKVHEIYSFGGSLGEYFDEKYKEIQACEAQMAEIKERISIIKGTRICAKCESVLERTAEYCAKCGTRQIIEVGEEEIINTQTPPKKESTPAPVPITAPEPLEPKKKICRVCNSPNDLGVKFCLSCGRILD